MVNFLASLLEVGTARLLPSQIGVVEVLETFRTALVFRCRQTRVGYLLGSSLAQPARGFRLAADNMVLAARCVKARRNQL